MQELERSRTILRRVVIVAVAIVLLVALFSDTLWMIYFSNQPTMLGYILNASIFMLFFFAMARVVAILIAYRQEEEALNLFHRNHQALGANHYLDAVKAESIIAGRVRTMHEMCLKGTEIPHQALAATLLAQESTRTGTVRFLHNVLILCGVLGTIVSLSIALLGAGNMLQDAAATSGMGLVIHGMSTALSTTMSAILCYLVLAYFLSAIQNLQTRFLGRVEEVTSTLLMPIYQVKEESVSQHAVALVEQAKLLLQTINEKISLLNFSEMQQGLQQERMHANQLHQETIAQAQMHHERFLAQAQQEHEESRRQLAELSAVLKNGFRLPGA